MLAPSPLVSVLTPVWNEATFIAAMLESMLVQDYENWELILVDDGSTDDTVDIITSYVKRDQRIKLAHHGTKLGKVRAFNTAFLAATGDVICHVGGDDLAPPRSIRARVESLSPHLHTEAVAYFKLRMFTDEPSDGLVLPRGPRGSRSGPSTTMTMPLSRRVFPVPESLPSEDLWTGEAARGLAAHVVHSSEVVVDYRVHPGNSNPRNRTFSEMSDSIHKRMAYAPSLLAESRFTLSSEVRKELELQWQTEMMRARGQTLSILRSGLDPVDRLGVAAMSNKHLWALRKRGYRFLSGWRGR